MSNEETKLPGGFREPELDVDHSVFNLYESDAGSDYNVDLFDSPNGRKVFVSVSDNDYIKILSFFIPTFCSVYIIKGIYLAVLIYFFLHNICLLYKYRTGNVDLNNSNGMLTVLKVVVRHSFVHLWCWVVVLCCLFRYLTWGKRVAQFNLNLLVWL